MHLHSITIGQKLVDKIDPPKTKNQQSRIKGFVPYLPRHATVRALLLIWNGKTIHTVRKLRKAIQSKIGTPQSPVDWSNPNSWINERLDGSDRELASEIWQRSDGTVNPRHTDGAWIFCRRYELLIETPNGTLELTEAGREFLQNELGSTEFEIDYHEGFFKLLRLIEDTEPCQQKHILPSWSTFLETSSANKTLSVFKDTLRRRLVNLTARKLVERTDHNMYKLSDSGQKYLQRYEETYTTNERDSLLTLARKQEIAIRKELLDFLSKVDPYEFERIVGLLLEELGYQNVEVTASSGDLGVDVIANIELGITSVREVVQVKRHSRTIQRKDLDALRGSLHRFNAVRGSIITTSKFSKGTEEAAFERGAAPITLIDGDKLVDLLIEHELGVNKQSIEVLRIDSEFFSNSSVNDV